MMECFIIPPLAHLDLMTEGERYFCLAHLYKQNQEYRNYFKRIIGKGKFVTLDNSAAERQLVSEDDLLTIVEDLHPHEVIAPDVLFDKNSTLENLYSFIEKMKAKDLTTTRIFGCPQGSTKEEWLECYSKMLQCPEVAVLGLSKISVPKCWLGLEDDQGIKEARNLCVKELSERGLIQKYLHCLGMGDPTEYLAYKDIRLVRSTDSCYTVLAAMNGIDFSKGFKRVKTPHDYFDQKMTMPQIKLALRNIKFLKQCLRGK